jgi:hypothetical protein
MGEIDKVKDTLEELNRSRLEKGLGAIRGYEEGVEETPATRGRNGHGGDEGNRGNKVGQSFLDNL